MAEPRVLRLRWHTTPPPEGCRWCGETRRWHNQRWVPGHRWHSWEQPTPQQIHARMRARHGLSAR